jgi:hypothetical protein
LRETAAEVRRPGTGRATRRDPGAAAEGRVQVGEFSVEGDPEPVKALADAMR